MKPIKSLIVCLGLVLCLNACKGPGGPMQRAGRSVDNAAAAVGRGVENTGEKIQEVAQ